MLQGIGNDGYLECVICGIAYRERYAVDGDRTLVNGEIATKCHFLVLGILEGEVGRTIGIFFLDAGGCLVYVALNDVAAYISTNTGRHTKTSMKSLLDRFMKAPYGFIEADVQWLVTKLFKAGDVAFFVNSEPVTLLSKTEDEIYRFVTRKEFNERLMMDRREKATDKQKKSVRDVMKALFKGAVPSDDDDAMMKTFLTFAESFKTQLEKLEIHYQNQSAYPGRSVIAKGKALMTNVLGIKFSSEFFKTVDEKRDDYFDLAEDFQPVKAFFEGDQKGIFDKSLLLMRIYDDSKTFVVDETLETIVKQIKDILRMNSPYKEIYKLPGLNEQFSNRYNAILDELLVPIAEAIAEARKRVEEEMDKQDCRQMFGQRCADRFGELKEKAESCNNVASLQNIKIEADAMKVRFLNEISTFVTKRQEEAAAEEERRRREQEEKEHSEGNNAGMRENGGATGGTKYVEHPQDHPVIPVKPVKKRKTISIKSVNTSTTWQLETQEDVQKYISALQAKLNGLLEDDTIINIEF